MCSAWRRPSFGRPFPDVTNILVLHGPNLNLLGRREPEIYGTTTLLEIDERLVAVGRSRGVRVSTFQSNHEGVLVDRIHATMDDGTNAVVLNAAGLTHTSIVLRDAIAAIRPAVPVVEVHLTVPAAREPFRAQNLLAGVVDAQISGLGPHSYELGLEAALRLTASKQPAVRDQP